MDCIEVYEKKNNQVGKTIKTKKNLQKKIRMKMRVIIRNGLRV